jgi:hypothetical protein
MTKKVQSENRPNRFGVAISEQVNDDNIGALIRNADLPKGGFKSISSLLVGNLYVTREAAGKLDSPTLE